MAVGEWQGGELVRGVLVRIAKVRYVPEGRGPRLTLEVGDKTGCCLAKHWKPTVEQARQAEQVAASAFPLAQVSGRVESAGAYAGELTLDDIAFPSPEDCPDLSHFLPSSPVEMSAQVDALDSLILSVCQPHLSALLVQTIGLGGRWRDDYQKATAARTNHHAFSGGLLVHSVEVADLALPTVRRFPRLHRDLLVTAALLHDIGKIWEMEAGLQCGQYTDAGHLLGHIAIGMERISHACRHLRFPQLLREQLLHAILSHHERGEWGSPVKPLTAEAITLAKCDQLSSELTQFYTAQAAARPDERHVRRGERSFFIAVPDEGETAGDLRDLPPPQHPSGDDPEERLMRRLRGEEGGAVVVVQREVGDAGAMVPLPIVGVVAAFDGIRAGFEDGDEPETHPTFLPPGGADFWLRVVGDSMTGAGILEGDLLLIRRQQAARVGQIVVAIVPQVGPVVKRLAGKGQFHTLCSENPVYAPIPVTPDVQLQGVVVRLERPF